jgi:hypothetical protein
MNKISKLRQKIHLNVTSGDCKSGPKHMDRCTYVERKANAES